MRYILILLFAFCFTYANVNKDNNDTKELSGLIDSIKSAKGDARRVKMNQLKLFLRSMNEKKRIKVIAKVKKILQEEQEENRNRPSKARESYINHNKPSQNDISKTQVPVHTNPVQPTPTHPNPSSQTHQPSRTPIPQSNPPSCPIPKPTNIIKHPPVAPPVSPPIIPKPNINIHVQEHIQQNINNVQHEIKNQIQHNIPTKFFPKLK